jgi:hypothetical protein
MSGIRGGMVVIGALSGGVIFSACSAAAQPAATAIPTVTAATTPAPTVTVTPTATLEPTHTPVDRPLYEIDAAIDTNPTADGYMPLTVRETAVYTNRAAEAIRELVLQFEPAREPDLLKMGSLSTDRAGQSATGSVENGQIHIPLDAPLAPGESVTVRLEFTRNVAEETALIGWNDYEVILANWYAFFPPYVAGRGWLAHGPGKVGEHLNYPYADFDIRFAANGGTNYWVAASGIAADGEFPLHFRFTGRSFAIALTTMIPHTRTAGDVEIIGYTRPQFEEQGNFMTDIAAKAVALYSEKYAPYPHKRLTLLESELPDGMELDGLVFLNPDLFPYYRGTGDDYLTAISAHETAHEWWYGRVGNDQAVEPWLDESFATYSELFFYERYYPRLVEWWWNSRVNQYRTIQCVDSPIYQFTGFREYVNAVYLRGVQMLDAVRRRMGNQPFGEALQDLQTAKYQGFMTAADVYGTFRDHSARPLNDIWNKYLCLPPAG